MVTEPVRESPPLTVLYDGACPLCRREIGVYRGLRPNTPVCFADVSDAALPLPPGTTREQLLARFHVRGRDGELLSGAEAFLALWAVLPGWRWPAACLVRPGRWSAPTDSSCVGGRFCSDGRFVWTSPAWGSVARTDRVLATTHPVDPIHLTSGILDMTKIALITGASGGIGRVLARQLHMQGCRVAAVGRDAGRLADVEAAVRIAADTTTPEGATLAMAACQEALGAAPTLLAHCVGSTLIAPLHRTRLEAYRELMRVNLDSAVFTLQAWIAALQGGPGAAVFVSSVVARIGVANHEAIAAAKGGVEALVRSAAATYAAQGLRINAVAPGMTETPMTAGMLKIPAMREGAARQYPLGGVQTAGQVADVMAWLLGDGAARLTGQVIAVDGGFTTVRPLVK